MSSAPRGDGTFPTAPTRLGSRAGVSRSSRVSTTSPRPDPTLNAGLSPGRLGPGQGPRGRGTTLCTLFCAITKRSNFRDTVNNPCLNVAEIRGAF